MSLYTSLFFGAPWQEGRDAAIDYIKDRNFDKIIIPCTGRFAVADAMVKAGIEPEKIISGDISMFTSLLGYFITGKDLSDLQIESNVGFLPDRDDEIVEDDRYVAELLYEMRYLNTKETNYYTKELKRAFVESHDQIVENLRETLNGLKTRLGNSEYVITDLRELINRYKDDPNVAIFLDPPIDNKDYEKMYDFGDQITWAEPDIPYFGTDEDKENLFADLKNVPATVISLIYEEPFSSLHDWHILELKCDTKMRKQRVYLNKDHDESYLNRPRFVKKFSGLGYPIISPDDVITEDSEIDVVMINNRDIANYYRDLFTHKFGKVSGVDMNLLLLVDGKIFSVRGYGAVAMSNSGKLHEMYGIIHNNSQYRHLGRLAMRVVTSKPFAEIVNNSIFELTHITTTSFRKFKDDREVAGIMELYDQEYDDKKGVYISKYIADFKDRSFNDCVRDWLEEERQRIENENKKKKKKKRRSRSRSQDNESAGDE